MKKRLALLAVALLLGCRTPSRTGFERTEERAARAREEPPPGGGPTWLGRFLGEDPRGARTPPTPLACVLPDLSSPSPIFAYGLEESAREAWIREEARRIVEEHRERELAKALRAAREGSAPPR